MELAAVLICQAAAWALTLSFFRADLKKGAPVAILSAFSAVLAQALLLWLGWTGLELPVLAAVSLLTALALPEVFHTPFRNAVTAFLLSLGGGALLWRCTESLLLLAVALCVCLAMAAVLAPYYPQLDWRELLAEPSPAEVRLNLRPWYLDIIFAFTCLAVNVAAWVPAAGLAAYIIPLLSLAVYWGGICLAVAVVEHRRAILAVTSEKQYREEMETFMNVIRSQRHDYNFHVRTLAGLVRKGDVDACRGYLEELVQDSMEMNEMLPIRDPAISATIFSFRTLAGREGITIHVDVQNDLSHIATNVYETNKIISNLLQNAIDAVSVQEDKSYGIWLYILKRGQFCVIHTANRFAGDLSADDMNNIFRQGYTTKQGHDGVGLSSIKSLAERNNGLVYARLEEDIIHFIAKIPLRYEASDEDKYRRED